MYMKLDIYLFYCSLNEISFHETMSYLVTIAFETFFYPFVYYCIYGIQ